MHRARLVLVLLAVVALLIAPAAHSASADMVVSQVYGGGGNSGASFANDFVELFNRGSTSVDLGSWSIQYASASGTTWQVTALSGSVQPGRHFLVQLASAAAIGAALPTPDATGTSNLANTGGKVALVRSATALSCGASAGSCSADPSVVDLIGYGSATDYEGTGAALALNNTTAR
jgi:predicted extracellular nuclease